MKKLIRQICLIFKTIPYLAAILSLFLDVALCLVKFETENWQLWKTNLTLTMKFLFLFSKVPMLVVLICLLTVGNLYSQFVPKAVRTDNTVIQELATLVEPHGWLHFDETSNIDPDSFFNNYASAMGLCENDEMVKTDRWDGEGQTHFRFKQHHKSIPVKYGDYILHAKNCKVILAHGKLVENLDIVLPATVSEATALQNALDAIGADKYAWEDTDWEYQAQEDMDDPHATWYPNGELEIYGEPDVDMTDDNFNLAYRFEIRSIDPFETRIVYVDAHNGQILSNLDGHAHATGTCSTLYYGTRTFETEQRGCGPTTISS